MDIPYGFDCYGFKPFEMKKFHSDIRTLRSSLDIQGNLNVSQSMAHKGWEFNNNSRHTIKVPSYVRFTRKNEEYTREQLRSLTLAGRLEPNEIGKQIFCGTKIQIGLGVVTNFLQMGLQYRKPIKGRAELVNGTWRGIVSGLTMDPDQQTSYDMAFGNFLAYDEEFPDMKFGPFYAIESKLVLLTGRSHRVEASSFGTNINSQLWALILALVLILSFLASFLVEWQQTKHQILDREILSRLESRNTLTDGFELLEQGETEIHGGILQMIQNFSFIYFAMLVNKPSLEFDNLVWPKRSPQIRSYLRILGHYLENHPDFERAFEGNSSLLRHYKHLVTGQKRTILPTCIRVVSYIWSAACLIMGSVYSGEMLAVILLHGDQNIDTISQLINSRPTIEPVIRQDDFTYNLMLKSLDKNMLKLHNMTKIIERPEVYTRQFIESVSARKRALLGDDELIETVYEIYSQHFPLYRSKTTYLQYPISIMYRNDLNKTLERELRRGLVQIFEMGLLHRWNEAQKETYIKFYEGEIDNKNDTSGINQNVGNSDQKYKPLSVNNFKSFFKLMVFCNLVAAVVLLIEITHFKLSRRP